MVGAIAAMAAWPLNGRAVVVDRGDTGAVPYDPTVYLGSAAHYQYGRPAYLPELEAVLRQERVWMGTAGFRMSAAALALLPSASLSCPSRRSVWTPTPTCWRRARPGPPGW